MSPRSYLIVGAGVFGVSTAYYLIQKYPDASITIVDRDPVLGTDRVAASWDWNKCVRADYDDFIYCRMAFEAQELFNKDPLFEPHFHRTGVFWVCRNSYAQDVINNYKKLGHGQEIRVVSVEEAKKMYGGLFRNSDYTGAKEILISDAGGWVAATDVLQAVTKRTMQLGVKYKVAEVANVVLDHAQICRGVRTTEGELITADQTILCTGAYTSKLLELSAATSGISSLCAGDRIIAGGITTGLHPLTQEEYDRFRDMPVGFQGYPPLQSTFMRHHASNNPTDRGRPFSRQLATDSGSQTKVVGAHHFLQYY
jgi:glycine/D-amino acid oxidase-like deaminating enzyme